MKSYKQQKPKLCWNVFVENYNLLRIKTFNVFDHPAFWADCRKNAKENWNDRGKFEEQLRRNLKYYFGYKCEWEIVLNSWPPNERFHDAKIDVCDQIELNWQHFADYVWNNRRFIYRRRTGETR